MNESETVTRVELVEHGRSGPVTLPAAARRALFAVAQERLRVLATAEPDVVVLEATSWVGTIRVPQLEIRIAPRAPMVSLFAMLGGLGAELAWGTQHTAYDADAELLDGAALVVLRSIDVATRRALVHGYRTCEEAVPAIRGRLLVDQLARRPWAQAEPPCRHDEFTVDIAENRLLRCAVRRVLGAPALSPATRREGADLLARFDGVADTDPREHTEPVRITRLNAHYESAMSLARLALEGTAINHVEGETEAHAFLVDVDLVFWRFVATELRTRLWPTLRVEQSHQLSLDAAATLRATADVVVHDASGPVLVVGVRYHLGEADPGTSPTVARTPLASVAGDAADFLPVVGQAAALGLPHALVVYAHASRPPASRIRIPATQTTVHSWHVDLRGSWAQIDAELGDLAAQVRAICAPAGCVS